MAPSSFPPDPARAAVIDRRVRAALAASLATVFDACAGHLAWQPADQHALLAALRSHSVAPAVFGLYAELVEALLNEAQGVAQARLEALLQPALRRWTAPRVITLDAAVLGVEGPALYARMIDDDAAMPTHIAAVDAAELARGQALHGATEALVGEISPALLHESEIVAHEVVLVRDTGPGAPPGAFGGASTFYLWGALFLNSARLQTRPQMAEALAHETAHAVLLGSTLGQPMVSNDPAARYRSPLRADQRQMDGIVHASYVLARMIWCQDRLLQSGRLDQVERDETAQGRATNRSRFIDSQCLIEAEARFTPEGAALWSAARDWVARSP